MKLFSEAFWNPVQSFKGFIRIAEWFSKHLNVNSLVLKVFSPARAFSSQFQSKYLLANTSKGANKKRGSFMYNNGIWR